MTVPRIAVTGSAGTGKTSLATMLAERYRVPLVGEAMRPRLANGLDLHTLTGSQHRKLLEADAEGWISRVEAISGGLVADRTALDFAAFWLCNGYAVDDPHGFGRLVDHAAAATGRLDAVFVLPWDAVPLVPDGVRSTNRWHQLHFQTVVEGLVRRLLPADRLHFLPPDVTGPERRAAFVAETLGKACSQDGL